MENVRFDINPSSYKSLTNFVRGKFELFSNDDKDFQTLYKYMFYEPDCVMVEYLDGYRIKTLTYSEYKKRIDNTSISLNELIDLPKGSTVGLYLENCIEWIEIFWSILASGYNPLLINCHLSKEIIDSIIEEYGIQLVISAKENFNCKTLFVEDILSFKNSGIPSKHWGNTVFFMSSGTSSSIKLCAYGAENFYYQISNSLDIVMDCPHIASHYNGSLKHLMLLPLYHIYGFVAVYLWFGFYSRTFVFLKDLKPETIQRTILKHKITHFLGVPLVWETIYKSTIRKIKQQGEKTYKKFLKGISLANKSALGYKIVYPKMKEVRDQLFGDSIKFLVSGGGYLKKEVSEFFNGIGYSLSNGFGMSEVGITSLERSSRACIRSKRSIGKPFRCSEYKINDNGELLIRGRNICKCIYVGKDTFITNYDEFFNSHDLVEMIDDRYYINGRVDDLIVSSTGENLNPTLIENSLKLDDIDEAILIEVNCKPTLIVSSNKIFNLAKANNLKQKVRNRIEELGYQNEIKDIVITPTSLIGQNDVKISRRSVKQRYLNKEIHIFKEHDASLLANEYNELIKSLKEIVHKILGNERSIQIQDHFFMDLGGTSLEYLLLADEIYDRFGLDIKDVDGASLYTIEDIYNKIIKID